MGKIQHLKVLAGVICAAVTLTAAFADEPIKLSSVDYSYHLVILNDELEVPWSIEFIEDGKLLVTERKGILRRLNADGTLDAIIRGTPETWQLGQGGYMGLALHPDYRENGWIYLAYTDRKQSPEGSDVAFTAIVRGRIKGDRWVDQEDIFRADTRFYTSGRVHFGCQMVFDKDGYLYFGIGERGRQEEAQDLSRPNGKIHRLHDDGRVPDDNPFVGQDDAYPSIWTYGNRNPQGLAVHPETGTLWETEHGPRGGDEVNIIEKGLNYGWPIISYGINYNGTLFTEIQANEGMEQPVYYWKPSIAASGLDVYIGDDFPLWKGNLIAGGLASEQVHRLHVLEGRVLHDEVIVKGHGRVRDVAISPEGEIYILLENPGRVAKLEFVDVNFIR